MYILGYGVELFLITPPSLLTFHSPEGNTEFPGAFDAEGKYGKAFIARC